LAVKGGLKFKWAGDAKDVGSVIHEEDTYIVEIDATIQIAWSFTLDDPNYRGVSGGSTPIPAPATPVPVTFGTGIWRVGTDIQSGTYRNSDSSGWCYWARLSGFSGGLADIIANNISDSTQTVTIFSGDAGFESERCGTWTKL
jgi:hypothetical protein